MKRTANVIKTASANNILWVRGKYFGYEEEKMHTEDPEKQDLLPTLGERVLVPNDFVPVPTQADGVSVFNSL